MHRDFSNNNAVVNSTVDFTVEANLQNAPRILLWTWFSTHDTASP